MTADILYVMWFQQAPHQERIKMEVISNQSTQTVTAQLTEDQIRALVELAAKRGTDANTVLQQAIGTEKLLDETMVKGDKLVINRGNNIAIPIIFDSEIK
jgi:hypothetical protein